VTVSPATLLDLAQTRVWSDDSALPGYEATTLPLAPDDDGPLCATLVRRHRTETTRRAVLYVHGFVDYFFQTHVADAFAKAGWDFYALDLRRYGRSLRGGNRPNYTTNLSHYDEELSLAIDIVRREEEHDTLVLLGHSTGGLITSWYMHRGALRNDVQGLVLNSPFFDFAIPASRRIKLKVATLLGSIIPSASDPKAVSRWYGDSLFKEHHGEWTYDLRWKPLLGFPAYFGWVRAVRKVQVRLAKGLSIASPVLLLHAGSSLLAEDEWKDAYLANDIVLDVEHMKGRGPGIGRDVTLQNFPDGVHDLFLSRRSVRDDVLHSTLTWLESRFGVAANV